jgi:protein-tyrosine phosphatase
MTVDVTMDVTAGQPVDRIAEKPAAAFGRRRVLTAVGGVALGSLVASAAFPAAPAAAAARRAAKAPSDWVDDPRLRFVDVEGTFNLRDAGDWRAPGGRRIKRGVIFRGCALGRVTDLGLTQLAALHLGVDINFLSNRELGTAQPDRLPPGVAVLNAPVGDEESASEPTAPDTTKPDEGVLAEFRGYITGPQALGSFGAALRRITELNGRPFYLHCNSGTYRTGWATAVLMTALGVDRAQVDQEFLLSNLTFGVQYAWTEYLDAAFDQINASFGSFDRYLRRGLGVSRPALCRLERALLVRHP